MTLITNYYTGVFVCIFSVLYFAYKIVADEKIKNIKEIGKKIGVFTISSLSAGLIAAIVLIPSFIGLKGGRADFSFSSLSFDKYFNLQDILCKFYTNAFDVEEIKNESLPPLFCGIFANVLVISYFFNKNIKIKEKIAVFVMFAIFTLSFWIRGINLLWMLGNIPAWWIYRYSFCFTFFYVMLAHRGFENARSGLKIWKIIASMAIYIGISIFVYNLRKSFD